MTIDVYKEQRGEKPFRVTLVERPEKGLTLWMRWYLAGKPKYEITKVRTIRDVRGRVQQRAVQKAQAEADAKIAELKGETRPAKRRAGPLTLREGVDLAFTARGPYPHDQKTDQWTKEAKGYAEAAIALLGGDDALWEEITPGMIRAVWRTFERDYRATGGGYNKAEKTVIVFFRISTWLQGEFQDQRFPAPLKGWRTELKEFWAKAGHDITPAQPRHSEEEIRKLFQHLPQADPRLSLAIVLGAELRGGQVFRTWRSHANLAPGAGAGRGVVDIPFVSKRKRAPRIFLNLVERAAINAAMEDGYLSELEAAYQAGEIPDYPLFPGGKLRKGKAPVRARLISMHGTSVADLLHDLERAAKVEPVKGRGWHGLRRAFTDLYPGATADARLLDHLGGWAKGSTMREGTYQEKENELVATEAARIREQVRPGIGPKEGGE